MMSKQDKIMLSLPRTGPESESVDEFLKYGLAGEERGEEGEAGSEACDGGGISAQELS